MGNIIDIVAEATNGKNFRTHRFCFDGYDIPTSFDYDDSETITWEKYGESAPPRNDLESNMGRLAEKIIDSKPLFSYFLDGSRRTYKVDDISYENQVFPIIAGQVGISCCTRVDRNMCFEDYDRRLAIALPAKACTETWKKAVFFENVKNQINEKASRLVGSGLEITDVVTYSIRKDQFERFESKGIAVI